jgi:hypothetical protein
MTGTQENDLHLFEGATEKVILSSGLRREPGYPLTLGHTKTLVKMANNTGNRS